MIKNIIDAFLTKNQVMHMVAGASAVAGFFLIRTVNM
jgi:hypothetical protein